MSDAVVDLLKRARERVAVPERWTQGADARDSTGGDVNARDPRAVCWCIFGALLAETKDEEYALRWKAEHKLDSATPRTSSKGRPRSIAFNDRRSTTHPVVIALLDRTIAELEAANV